MAGLESATMFQHTPQAKPNFTREVAQQVNTGVRGTEVPWENTIQDEAGFPVGMVDQSKVAYPGYIPAGPNGAHCIPVKDLEQELEGQVATDKIEQAIASFIKQEIDTVRFNHLEDCKVVLDFILEHVSEFTANNDIVKTDLTLPLGVHGKLIMTAQAGTVELAKERLLENLITVVTTLKGKENL